MADPADLVVDRRVEAVEAVVLGALDRLREAVAVRVDRAADPAALGAPGDLAVSGPGCFLRPR